MNVLPNAFHGRIYVVHGPLPSINLQRAIFAETNRFHDNSRTAQAQEILR